MSVQATETQIGIYNNTSNRISVRLTNSNHDSPTGNKYFVDIEPGKYNLWDRRYWQVAFVVRNSTRPFAVKPETLILKPSDVHYINDE